MNMSILTCISINGDKLMTIFLGQENPISFENGVEVPSSVFEQILQRLFKSVAAKLDYEIW